MNGTLDSTIKFVFADNPQPGSDTGASQVLKSLSSATGDPLFWVILSIIAVLAVSTFLFCYSRHLKKAKASSAAGADGSVAGGAGTNGTLAGGAGTNGTLTSGYSPNNPYTQINRASGKQAGNKVKIIAIAVIAVIVACACYFGFNYSQNLKALADDETNSSELDLSITDIVGKVDNDTGSVTFSNGTITNNGPDNSAFTYVELVKAYGIDDDDCTWTITSKGKLIYKGKAKSESSANSSANSASLATSSVSLASANSSSANLINPSNYDADDQTPVKVVIPKNGGSIPVEVSVEGLSGATAKNLAGKNVINLKSYCVYNETSINLDKNGGQGGTDQVKAVYAENLPSVDVPSKTGYDFLGYFYEKTNTKYIDSNGDGCKEWDLGTDNIKLVAQWFALTPCQVTFDTNGGLPLTWSQTEYIGKKIPKPEDPTKAYYNFAGWYKDSTFQEQWDFDNDTLTGDVVLYAKWDAYQNIPYKVVHQQQNVNDDNYTVVETEEFKGYTDQKVTPDVKEYEGFISPSPQTVSIKGDGSTVVTYSYDRTRHSVTFDSNGHGTSPATIDKVRYQALVPKPADPTAQGYVFEGWYKEPDCTNKWDFDEDTMPNANLILYAKWSPATDTPYTVVHKQQNINDDDYTTFETEHKTGTTESQVTPDVKEYTGFTSPAPQTITIKPDGSSTVTYLYTRNKYSVTFDNKGKGTKPEDQTNVKFGALIVNPGDLTEPGYTFSGWYEDEAYNRKWEFATSTMPARNITLYAKWDLATDTPYKVVHQQQNVDDDQYTVVETEHLKGTTFSKVTPAVKTYVGFTSPEPSELTILPDGSAVMTYSYTRNKYTAHFENFDKGTQPADQNNIKFGAKINNPGDLNEQGYTFEGWYKEAECQNQWLFSTDTMPASDVNLYAKWLPAIDTPYTVIHQQQNIVDDEYTTVDTQHFTGTTGTTVTPEVKTYEGFTSPATQTATIKADGSLTITYQYTRNKFSVTFENNDKGTKPATQENVKYGAKVTNPGDIAETGYVFEGWYKEAINQYKWYFDTDTMPNNDITLYAKWVPATNTPYKVIHQQQNVDNDEYTTVQTEDLTGTTGATVTPEVKSYTGFTSPAPAELTIKADGTSQLTYKYARNKYKVTFDVKGKGSAPETITDVKFEAKVTEPTPPQEQGYVFKGWYKETTCVNAWDFSTDTMPAKDVTLYALWDGAEDTAYTVIHQQQNVADDNYTTVETQSLTGKTDTAVTPETSTYTGFTSPATQTATIKADGSLTITYKYTRNKYFVSFNTQGKGTAPQVLSDVKYGALVTKPADPTETGYVFDGWYKEDTCETPWDFYSDTVPASNLVLYAKWTPSTDTPYTVIHQQQNIENDEYATYETESFTGTTGSTVTPDVKSYDGFTSPQTQSITINPDGTSSVTYQYTRNKYSVTFDNKNKGTKPADQTNVKYGAKVVEPDPITEPGYVFAGWFKDEVYYNQWNFSSDTMPASNMTLYAKWDSATDTTYKVIHKQQNVDDEEYVTAEIETLTGTTWATVYPAVKTYEGFTSPEPDELTILPDGSASITYNYPRNTYTVSFENFEKGIKPQDLPNIKFGAKVTNPGELTQAGYTFEGWYKDSTLQEQWIFGTDTIPASNTTLFAKWDSSVDTQYTVVHQQQNIDNDEFTTVDTETLTGTTGEAVTPDTKTYTGFTSPATQTTVIKADGTTKVTYQYTRNKYTASFENNAKGTKPSAQSNIKYGAKVTDPGNLAETGYVFEGWYNEEECETRWYFDIDTMPNNDITLYAKWSPATNTPYKVIHQQQKISNDEYITVETEKLTGTTDTTVTPAVKTYTGFTSPSAQELVINADGSSTLTYSYTRNKHSITFDNKGKGTAPETITDVKYGATVTEPTTPVQQGYNFEGWYKETTYVHVWNFATETMPDNDVTLYAKWTGSEDTHYTVVHQQQNVLDDTFITKDTEDLTGKTGSTVTPDVKSYTGFTAPATQSKVIMPDGSTTFTYQYTRNKYTVTFDTQGKGVAPEQIDDVKYEATITQPSSPTAQGYVFDGWYKESTCQNAWDFSTDTIPASNTTLYAKWTPATNTQYTVVHMQQNVNDDSYATIETESFTGTTDSTVTPDVKSYTGFTAPSTQSITIKADGTSSITYQYNRNKYSASFENNKHGDKPGTQTNIKYGSLVADPGDLSAAGYTFVGWYTDSTLKTFWNFNIDTMPSDNITLYAKWAPNTDTTYTVNHLQQNIADDEYTNFETETLTGTTGSNVTPQVKTYAGFTSPSTETILIKPDGSASVTYYYNRNKHSVSYDAQGKGVEPQGETNIKYGALVADPGNLTQQGYVFGGWYKEAECQNQWDFSTDTMADSDITLYAQWTPATTTAYKVVHRQQNVNDDEFIEIETENLTGTTGATVTPQVKSYVGFVSPQTRQLTILADGSAEITYDYNRDKNTVTFQNFGKGTQPSALTNVKYGAKVTDPGDLTETGYQFGGWYKEVELENAWNFDVDTMPETSITLYAKWSVVSYSINWQYDGGTAGETAGDVNYTIQSTTINMASAPTKAGYTFAGWLATPQASGTISGWPTDAFINAPALNNANGNVILTAQWNLTNYSVTWNTNGGTAGASAGSGTYTINDTSITLPDEPTKEGYSFAGWLASAPEEGAITGWPAQAFTTAPTLASATGNVILTAQWTEKSYTISWQTNGGTAGIHEGSKTYGVTSTEITMPDAPTKTGYTFAGWLASAEQGGTISGWPVNAFIESPSLLCATGNVVLTAQWSAVKYDITWQLNGGSATTTAEGTRAYTINYTTINLPDAPIKSGYTFNGWLATAAEESSPITNWPSWPFKDAPTLTNATGNVVLTAQWLEDTYSINWETNGGTAGIQPGSSNYKVSSTTISMPDEPTKDGYTFAGWKATAKTESGTITGWPYEAFRGAPVLDGATGNVVLTAQWNIITYGIRWENNGGTAASGSAGSTSYNVESSTITLPSAPTKTGCTFDGWKASADTGSTITNWPTDTFSDAPTLSGATGNVVLTAQWTEITYSIDWNTNDGDEGENAGSSSYTVSSTTIDMPDEPSKSGYTFDGWVASASEESGSITGWPTSAFKDAPTLSGATGDVKLTAQWTVVQYSISWDSAEGTEVSGGSTSYTVEDTTITLPTAPTKTGAAFKGWLASAASTDDSENAESDEISGWPTDAFTDAPTLSGATGNVMLTAQWETATMYTVTMNLNSGRFIDGTSAPSGWTELAEFEYTKQFAEGTNYSTIVSEWSGVSLEHTYFTELYRFDGFDKTTGVISADETISVKWTEYYSG